ncbi:unnamed protein product [Urochloa decumbens]|uniref:Uncharacterized protein n=1 Tax=Urochloa decumbens TaxID=240449 RepID=A0ABC9AQP5_9POAL
MKITVESSKAVKPATSGSGPSVPAGDDVVPLTVFDKVNFDEHILAINFFSPPAPPNAALKAGLAEALAHYREWAGRIGVDATGNRVILLTDAGARFVEAVADVTLASLMPLEPAPALARLRPSGDGAMELLLVQVTRFPCGGLAVGYAMHHAVGDGRATSSFLVSWGQATRGAAISPVPVHDRVSMFIPRDPPRVEFDHRSIEFKKPRRHDGGDKVPDGGEAVVVHRVSFSREMVSELKSCSSASTAQPYSTAQCVVAHLWRCITEARMLSGGTVTKLHLAVNGCARMRVPKGYTGNMVLWAQPVTTAGELAARPLRHAAELVSRAVARVDERYFRSFVDFASSGAVEKEGLVPATGAAEVVLCPDVAVYSQLGFPVYDMDFGGGRPFLHMPSYMPEEGVVFIAPSSSGDGGIDAYVSLFSNAMCVFKSCCYTGLRGSVARL